MKAKLLNIVFVAFAVVFLVGCSKKESLNVAFVGLGGDDWIKTELDQWLYTNFTNPYNIEVKYRWDRSELDSEIYKNAAPIKEELVKPVMEAIKKVWIEPYIAVKDEDFLKKYTQKQFYLVGSPTYRYGTKTLGLAEAGRKIVLLDLNTFSKGQKSTVKEVLHTMHHEFGHILNQNMAVNPEYRKITPSDYTAVWYLIAPPDNDSDLSAQAAYEADFWGKGFITPYSRANKDEDFVEMLATLLEGGEAYFNNIINNLFIYDEDMTFTKRNSLGIYEKNTDARNKLLKKKAMVVSYLANSWGINFAALQAKTQAAIERVMPTPDLPTMLGSDEDKIYNKITINPQRLTGLSAKFLTAFNTANIAMLVAPNSRYIDNISLIFSSPAQITLRVNYFDSLLPPSEDNNFYEADFIYTISKTDNLIKMTYDEAVQPVNIRGMNANNIKQYLQELLGYFNAQEFNIRWVDNIVPQSKGIFGGVVKASDPSSSVWNIKDLII